MKDDTVEKVARAICKARGGQWREPPWTALHTDALNNGDRFIASAAIEALREPSEVMQLAGHRIRTAHLDGGPSAGTDEIFTAMIDAALASHKEKA